MQRIYLPNTEFSQTLTITEKELYHQITRVMRARVGQEYIFFDGENIQDSVYKISGINKTQCVLEKISTIQKNSEAKLNLSLYQAMPNKLSKLEYIVQKCCEVGYSSIIFFESERSQKLVLSESKKERLKRIAIEASEQCGGNIIPTIYYRDERGEISEGTTIVCHTQGDDSVSLGTLDYNDTVNVIVGPEGGFSPEEISSMGAQQVYFGERILRCETVGEVVGFYLNQK